jgi:chromosome segregation ATPase
MSGEQVEETQVERLDAAVFEQRRLAHMLRQRGTEIESLQSERERLAERGRKAAEHEEALRRKLSEAERGAASLSQDCARLAADLKRAEYEVRRAERRLAAREEAQARAAVAARDVEEMARELGRTQREVELLAGQEKHRETLLADSDRALGEVAEHLRRVSASRSWRWGHRLAVAWRTLTLRRRRSKRSALDRALACVEAGENARAGDECRT